MISLMRTIVLVTAMMAMQCVLSYAQAPAQVVRIICDDGGGTRSMGSGVYVRSEGLPFVLTNQHVIADARDRRAVTVRFTSIGRDVETFVMHSRKDSDEDIAMLRLLEPVPVEPLEIADTEDGVGYIYGFGPNQRLMGSETRYRQAGNWTETQTPVRQGDSGSPILDRQGRVVGIIWGSDSSTSVAVRLPILRSFVRSTIAHVRAAVTPRQWSGICNNGQCYPTQPRRPLTPVPRQPYMLQPVEQLPPKQPAPQTPPPASPPDTTDKDCLECEERFGKLEQRLEALEDGQGKLKSDVVSALETQQGRVATLEQRLAALSKPLTVVYEGAGEGGKDVVASVPLGGEIRLPSTEVMYVDEDNQPIDTVNVPVGGRLALGFGTK